MPTPCSPQKIVAIAQFQVLIKDYQNWFLLRRVHQARLHKTRNTATPSIQLSCENHLGSL